MLVNFWEGNSLQYQASAASPTNTDFVCSISWCYICTLWVVSKQKNQYESPRKNTPPKQVILDDVGGDIISKIPTSPSFFDSFWRYQIWLEQDCSLTPIQNKQLETPIHWSLYNFPWSTCFLLWHTTQVPQEKKHTLDNPELGGNQETLPSSKLCYPWRRKLLRVSHGNRRKKMGGSLCGWTAVSIITPFPGTSTLGVGAARAIWVRLEIVSWRIMVKIEHLGNQHRKSFCRCSFWRSFTGHVLFCSWIFFFALQLISVPQKNTLATQQTFCNYIPASPRVKLGDPAWSSGLESYRCRCGWNVGARLKQITSL